jgi:hypothetical protein
MNCDIVPSSSAEAIDAFNLSPRAQIQLPRDMTRNANVSVTMMPMVLPQWKLAGKEAESYPRVEDLPIGRCFQIQNASYSNFSADLVLYSVQVNCRETAPRSQVLFIEAKANYGWESVEQLKARFLAKPEAISGLRALVDEYKADKTTTIYPTAVSTAERFLHALPDSVSLPEFSIEPDGSISLDWMDSPNRLFSLSVGVNNRLACAWLDGTNKGHFVESFDGQQISDRIIRCITSIVKNGHA